MPILKQLIDNYDEFDKQPYMTKFKAVNDFFEKQLSPDPEFQKLPPEERAKVRRNFIDDEIGSTMTGADSILGDAANSFLKGSNRVANTPADMLNLIGAWTARGMVDETWASHAADWWENHISDKAYWDKKTPTGKYEQPVEWSNPEGWLQPRRIMSEVLDAAPYTVAAMAAFSAGAPVAKAVGLAKYTVGVQRAMSLALTGITEGGNFADTMKKAERESGTDIPWHLQASLAAMVGTANGILENILPDNVSRALPAAFKKRLSSVIMEGLKSGSYEASTEVLQEVVSMLGEAGYGAQNIDWYGRTAAAFHGAFPTGFLFGAQHAASVPTALTAEEKTTAVPVGKTPQGPTQSKAEQVVASVMTADAVNKYAQAFRDFNEDPSRSDRKEAMINAETDLIKLWQADHPNDITGEDLGKAVADIQINPVQIVDRIRGTIVPLQTSVEPVKIPTKIKDISTLTFRIPKADGSHHFVAVSVASKVPRKQVNRSMTAFSFLRNEYKDVYDKVKEVVVLPDGADSWIHGVVSNGGLGSGVDADVLSAIEPNWLGIAKGTIKEKEDFLQSLFGLGDLHKKAGVLVKRSDGNYRMLLRAGSSITTSDDFAFIVGHELEHVRQYEAGSTPSAENRQQLEESANLAGTKAKQLFKDAAVANPHLLFSRTNPEANKPGFDATVRYRALAMLGHNFSDIRVADGSIFIEDPNAPGTLARVNGYTEMDTGTLWLSQDASPWVIGHEAAHVAIGALGKEHTLVKQGLEMFGNNEEALSDAIGKYFELRMSDKTMIEKLGQWLKDLWAEFVRSVGVQQSQEQLLRSFNKRITDEAMFPVPNMIAELQDRRGVFARAANAWKEKYEELKGGTSTAFAGSPAAQALDKFTEYEDTVREIDERIEAMKSPRYNIPNVQFSKMTTTLRFYDNLAQIKGRVNLRQLPLKNLKKEESAFVQGVAQDLMDVGKTVVSPEELKQAIEAAKLPVTVEVELKHGQSFNEIALSIDELKNRVLWFTDVAIPKITSLADYQSVVIQSPLGGHITITKIADGWAVSHSHKEGEKVVHTMNDLQLLLNTVVSPKPEPYILGSEYTVPGYNPITHNRWLFTTPIDFGEKAHPGIDATNAIGWTEVAENALDPKTLMVFEVQPSDTIKEYAEIRENTSITGIKSFIHTIAPHINTLMYRGILQEAARKGFERVLFPVGDTVEAIEGTDEPVELYNRMAERLEKEFKGQTSHVRVLNTFGNERSIREKYDAGLISDKELDTLPKGYTWLQVSLQPGQAEKPILMFSKSREVYNKDNVELYYGDATKDITKTLGNRKVNLTVTSPPYNIGINYDSSTDQLDLTEYKKFTEDWLSQVYNVTADQGRLFINLPLYTKGIESFQEFILPIARSVGWKFREYHIWDKYPVTKGRPRGTYGSQKAPYTPTQTEQVIVFYKGTWAKDTKPAKPLDMRQFLLATNDIWKILPYVPKNGHPAAFPVQLPGRAINGFSYEGETVLDPFVGSGSSAVAAKALKRKFIGFDLSDKYLTHAAGRVEEPPPKLLASRYHAWRKDVIDSLLPPGGKEKTKKPSKPQGIRWGFKDFAETQAAQNIINATPDDVRKVMDAIARTKKDETNPDTYGTEFGFGNERMEAYRISVNPERVSELYNRVMQGDKSLTPAEIGGLQRGLLKRSTDLVRRMDLTKDETGALKLLRDAELQRYFKALNTVNIHAGWASKILDLHQEQDKMNALFAGLQAFFAGEIPAAVRENILQISTDSSLSVEAKSNKIKNVMAEHEAETSPWYKKFRNVAYSFMFEGMLSGAANIKNLSSNWLWLETNILALRPLQAASSRMLSSKWLQKVIPSLSDREAAETLPEVWAMLKEAHSVKTIRRAWAVGKLAWREAGTPALEELPTEHRRKWDRNVDLKTKWEIAIGSIESPWRAIGVHGKGLRAVTLFSRSLIMVDAFFKTLAFDAEMQAQIVREMQKEGKSYDEVEATPEMKSAATAFMNKVTFMDKPGDIAHSAYAVRRMIDRLGLPGTAIIPFVNTLSNILQRGIELTPGIGAVSGARDIHTELTEENRRRRNVAKNSGVPFQQAKLADSQKLTDVVASQAAGLVLTMLLLGLMKDDDGEDRITGAPPEDARERQTFLATKQPYSVRVGKHWISYRNVEPLNVVLSNMIAAKDALKESDDPTKHVFIGERLLSAATSVINNVFQSSYMDGIFTLFKDGKLQPSALTRIPASFIPYSSLMRSMYKTYEVVNTGEYTVADNRHFLAPFANTLAWLPEEITHLKRTPRINALGEEIKVHVGKGGVIDGLKLWFPLGVMDDYTDPVEEELADLQLYIDLPDKMLTIKGNKVMLPEDFYREYALLYGKYTKEALTKAMSSSRYRTMDDDNKVKYLKKMIAPARRKARLIATRQYKTVLGL